MRPRLPSPTLFPYTTLFRSQRRRGGEDGGGVPRGDRVGERRGGERGGGGDVHVRDDGEGAEGGAQEGEGREAGRSEEHTSELQSRGDLVCRLLLEKNKQNIN